jgi:hypothetical protein
MPVYCNFTSLYLLEPYSASQAYICLCDLVI